MSTKNGFVVAFKDLSSTDFNLAGGKGGSLAHLYQAGFPVPDGLIIMPSAFDKDDQLHPEAWEQIKKRLESFLKKDKTVSFAIRSSALCEDSTRASFAGQFETVLDVRTNEAIKTAISKVRISRKSDRVKAYSKIKTGVDASSQEIAVIIQEMVRSDISGVLFTADPVSGDLSRMVGNFVHGLGDKLVSGESDAQEFIFERFNFKYEGPSELRDKSVDKKLYKLGNEIETFLKCPQDIEWAVDDDGKLYLLQSRPVTTLVDFNPATGEWNGSVIGNYLWSNVNSAEAIPGVITPLSWTIWNYVYDNTMPFKIPRNVPFAANIGGRVYFNFSVMYSILKPIGAKNARHKTEELLGRIPDGLKIPEVPFSKKDMANIFIRNIPWEFRYKRLQNKTSHFIQSTPQWCSETELKIEKAQSKSELLQLWQEEIKVYLVESFMMVRVGLKKFMDPITKLSRIFENLVGTEDKNALLSNLSGDSHLESLGPLIGLSKVAKGEMRHETYLELYGHRHDNEVELYAPQPKEDPSWLEKKLEEFKKTPFDINKLLSKQRAKFDIAWNRFQDEFPKKSNSIFKEIKKLSFVAHEREAIRSELIRIIGVIRKLLLKIGELSKIGDGIFFLTLTEFEQLLNGNDAAIAFISARKETHINYLTMSPYPSIIVGRFDPHQWFMDPKRRNNVFDSRTSNIDHFISTSNVIKGFAGAAGRIEGIVRRIDSPDEGNLLQPGEILVTSTTNIGWTLLFPRASAIVTDIGAPLSHAAIVARELGIPAVVGCVNATSRLCTGDKILVDGGQGIVEIIQSEN